jgi:Domain of unknown function (DUF4384)
MLSVTLLSMVVSTAPALPVMPSVAVRQDEPQVRVWLNKRDNVDFGDRVRVYVQAQSDGHLVVLHADPDGRVHILQPVNPAADDLVRGGRAYEVKGAGNREAFRARDVGGVGTVYVAYSPEPFVYDVYRRANQWDNDALGVLNVEGNTTEQLTELVQGMSPSGGFIYDLVDYYVAAPVGYDQRGRTYDDAYYYDPDYYDPYYYDPYSYRYRPTRFGLSFGWYRGFGFGIGFYHRYPYYYDPFYWDAFYWDPFYWDPFYSSAYWYPRSWYYGTGYYYPTTVVVTHGTVRHRYAFRTNEPGNAAQYRRRGSPGTVASSNAVTLRRSVTAGSNRRLATTGNGTPSVSRRRVTSTGAVGSPAVARRRVDERAPAGAQPVRSGSTRRATGTSAQPARSGSVSATRRVAPSSGSGSATVTPRTAVPARRPSGDATPAARRPSEAAASSSARRAMSAPIPSRREVQAIRAGEDETGKASAARKSAGPTRLTSPVRATKDRASSTRMAIPSQPATSRGSVGPVRRSNSAQGSPSYSRPSLQRRSSAARPSVKSAPRSSSGSSTRSAPARRPSGSSASASRSSSGSRPSTAVRKSSGSSSKPSRGSSGRRRGGN